jgi:2,5-dioxopentanoate dehydrogenase
MDTGMAATRLIGESFVGSRRVPGRPGAFRGVNPATGEHLDPAYGESGPEEIGQACASA